MAIDLDQIKLQQFSDKLQVTIFDLSGAVIESCNSVLDIEFDKSVFDQFFFLKSLEEVFPAMDLDEEQRFTEVEWQEQKTGLFHLIFKKINGEKEPFIQWTIIDNTFYYDKLLNLQQSRNDSAIGEEFAQIKKRAIEAENELLEFKNEELQRIQEFKSQFFAKVSHEMRTPLNAITGLVGLLEKQKSEQHLKALYSTSKHLGSIINDILDLSKIEAGKLEFEEIDFDLTSLVNGIVAGFEYSIQDKKVQIEVRISQNLVVKGDPTRFAQILYNLIGNSLKFTEFGSIRVEIQAEEIESNLLNLNILVSDTGIGMSEEAISNILEPYAQASNKTARYYGGTGLGLSICKQLIEAFGGRLKIESELGQGTNMSFSISLPVGHVSQLHNSEAVEIDLAGIKVLLGEDDPVSAQVISSILTSAHALVEHVSTGEELQNYLQEERFDIVVTDVNLEGKSGYDVFQESSIAEIKVPFIFLTGESISVVHPLAELMIKPVEKKELLKAVETLLRRNNLKVDLSKIKKSLGEEALIKDMLNTVAETLPTELENLLKAFDQKDVDQMRKVLHKIKPSIDYLGNKELARQRGNLHSSAEDVDSMTLHTFSKDALALLLSLGDQLTDNKG